MVLQAVHDNGNANDQLFLMDWIRKVIDENAHKEFSTWYNERGQAVHTVTYGGLWEQAGVISSHLRTEWHMDKGDCVVLCYTPGIHFFASLLGCFRAGVIAVLVYPPDPSSAERLASSLTKMRSSIDDCQPKLVLCDAGVHRMRTGDNLNVLFSKSRNLWPNVPFRVTENLRTRPPFDESSLTRQDIAFLQYTSGSTGDPKGVMVNFGALAANITLIHNGYRLAYREDGGIPDNMAGFSWLPQYHDLGLIYAGIAPFLAGMRMYMMSPITFMRDPLLWMDLMSQHKVSWGVAPDFAYNLVTRRFQQALKAGKNPLPGLDLSCIHNLQSGTEPIRPHTKRDFEAVFAPYGLRKNWFLSGYGLAENVVGVCFMHGYHLSTPRAEEDVGPLVAVGSRRTFDKSLDVRIVHPETNQEVQDGTTGELWVGGPSIAAGYYGKPELSSEAFCAQLVQGADEQQDKPCDAYLRTGDLAFIQNDKLYICGRIKDLLIVNGRNYYPSDIELAAQEATQAVRPGCVAAFSADEVGTDSSSLTIVFEIRNSYSKKGVAGEITTTIRQCVMENIGLMPTRIVAIKERSIPKTTSGKLRRRATRSALNEGSLSVVFDDQKLTRENPTGATPPPSTSKVQPDEQLSAAARYDRALSQILGANYNPKESWEINGLSSLQQVELVNQLSGAFPVDIPADFQSLFDTPMALKGHILGPQAGAFFPTEMEELPVDQSIPKMVATAAQMVGVLVLLSLLSLSTLPVYYLVAVVTEHSIGDPWQGLLLPPIIVLWHFSFSVVVLLTKWLVIGKYSQRKAFLPSIYYLRWWLVDRALELWEYLSGRFVKNTPLIWIFYRLMGVRMPYQVRIDAYLREFDLLRIDAQSSIERDIRARKFGSWESTGNCSSAPSIRFRPIHIGANCTIRGHVGLGSSIGQGSWVEKLSSIPESSLVPPHTVAIGSPAHQSLRESRASALPEAFVSLEMGKLAWILVQVCFASLLTSAGEWVFSVTLRETIAEWRYASLVEIAIVFACSTILGLLACIPLKWILIGRRQPGKADGPIDALRRWMVDYTYSLYRTLFDLVALNSLTVNFYLRAMGADIDLKSKVWPARVPPSKADLVSLRQSLVTTVDFDVSHPLTGEAAPQRIVLENSSIGHTAVLAGGVTVRHAEVLPFSHVTNDMIGDRQKWNNNQQGLPSLPHRAAMDFMAIILILLLTASFIPTLEVFHATAALDGSMQYPMVRVILALCVHSVTWFLLFMALHRLLFWNGKSPLNLVLYFAYMTIMEHFFELSLTMFLFGTPFMSCICQGFGCRMNRQELWFFGRRLYDAPLITFHGPTIVDSSSVNGHLAVLGKLAYGECKVRGVLHEGTVCLAYTNMAEKQSKGKLGNDTRNEVGPMCFVAPSRVATACPTDTQDAQVTQFFEDCDNATIDA